MPSSYSLDRMEFSPGFCALEGVSGPVTPGLRLTVGCIHIYKLVAWRIQLYFLVRRSVFASTIEGSLYFGLCCES